jgi:glycine/D-amino acid oxidase-like deaminating enzyme
VRYGSTKRECYFVAGRGFGGLAICYHLKKKVPDSKIFLFDPNPLFTSTSSAASGLLEPIGGRLAARSPRANEGLEATKELLDAASLHVNKKVYKEGGVLHAPISDDQRAVFEKKRGLNPRYFEWTQGGEFLVKEGMNVFSRDYLGALYSLVLSMGVEFVPEKVPQDPNVKQIFYAIGKEIDKKLPGQFQLIRGQAMQVQRGESIFNLPKVHKGYIALDSDPTIYHVGSTFEKTNLDLPGDKQVAVKELIERNREIFPEVAFLSPLGVYEGIRVYSQTQERLPQIVSLGGNQVALAGLGSKGLLYHALYAKEIVSGYA